MKIAKTRYDYIFFIYIPFAMIGILLNLFCQSAIVNALKIFMPLTFIVALVCILTPIGTQKPLTNPALKTAEKYWFVQLICLQLSVILIFIGFSQAIIHFMMSNPTHQTSIYLVQQTLNFYQGGLWPWPFILLVSCALAYSGRIEKQPALLRQAIKPVIKKYADGIIGAGIDIFLKQGLLFSTVLTIGIITLQIAHVLSQLMQLPALLTFSVHTVIIGTLLLIFVAQNPFIQKLTRKLQSQRYADNKLILIFCLLIIFLLIAFNALLYFVKIYFLPDHTINIPLPAIHNYNHIKLWYLLSFIWWLGVMPLLARTIADIARDRSLRELLSAGLLLPVLLSAGWRLSNHYSADAATVITSLMECQPITLLIGGFSLLSAAYLFSNPHTCNIAAAANTYKPAGHSTLSFLRILWQLCACMLAAYLLTNLNLLTYLGAALTAPIFVTLFFALSAELINLISTEK